jgi:hypothetical protein
LRVLLYAAIALASLCRTLGRIMSEPIRPFDWWMLGIEAAVLILIAYEIVAGVRERRGDRRRKRLLDEKRNMIWGFVLQGRELRYQTPPSQSREAAEWVNSVKKWEVVVVGALGEHSERASGTFTLVAAGRQYEVVELPNKFQTRFTVSGEVSMTYQRLMTQLELLNEIMEKADFYF